MKISKIRTDSFGVPIYTANDIIEMLYNNQKDLLTEIQGDPCDPEILKFNESATIFSTMPITLYQALDVTTHEFDYACQHEWLMPNEYKDIDIHKYVLDNCPEQNIARAVEELEEFKQRDMLDLLRWLRYFVDTCRKNNIVWGVGRGSSVASYVLFLLGVHKIDSIKYNLDWREFLR